MKKLIVILVLVLLFNMLSYGENELNDEIQLIVNGVNITELSNPVILNNRLLVPIRFVSEEIGATVLWDGESRTVSVNKGNRSMLLKIDSRLVRYNNGEIYNLSDVAPIIINERTYVPLRLVSNALGIGIKWEETTRTVYVDSNKTSSIESVFDIKIISFKNGDTITEKSNVQIDIPSKYYDNNNEIKLLLLDKNTGKGFVVASEKLKDSSLVYLPKVEDKGEKILAVAIYDNNRKLISADSILININVEPKVILTGINDGITVDKVSISQELNFLAKYVKYELINIETNKKTTINERDPFGYYTWTPTYEQNGSYIIKVIAYDGNNNFYESQSKTIIFNNKKRLSLSGVTNNKTINKPVNLIASRNFDVLETVFTIKDVNTGEESIIATIPYGSYKWFPDSKYSGTKDLFVSVKDMNGNLIVSPPVRVNIDGEAKLYLYGVSPKSVVTKEIKLWSTSNVEIKNINYVLTNSNGEKKYIDTNVDIGENAYFNPNKNDGNNVSLHVEGTYNGEILKSDKISFKVYLNELYGPKAITEKSEFLDFASVLAVDSLHKTGMSAALQTAQAILETGWGQKLPVDKYSGKFSYNLFGIKGKSTNGSVTSNTWEVYNGVSYRVDANFRAYNNIDESWQDHKRILLELSRYEQFRDVMYDSTLGAWAIRRAGYATDPQYPIKLMNIIEKYNLNKLDEVSL